MLQVFFCIKLIAMARTRAGHVGNRLQVEDFGVSFGIAFRKEETSNGMRTEARYTRERSPGWAGLSVLSVKDAVESEISKRVAGKNLSAKAKYLHESARNCVFGLFIKPNTFRKLTDEMLTKSVADFVVDFKIFRPFDKEMVVVAAYL